MVSIESRGQHKQMRIAVFKEGYFIIQQWLVRTPGFVGSTCWAHALAFFIQYLGPFTPACKLVLVVFYYCHTFGYESSLRAHTGEEFGK